MSSYLCSATLTAWRARHTSKYGNQNDTRAEYFAHTKGETRSGTVPRSHTPAGKPKARHKVSTNAGMTKSQLSGVAGYDQGCVKFSPRGIGDCKLAAAQACRFVASRICFQGTGLLTLRLQILKLVNPKSKRRTSLLPGLLFPE
jgi:hypothetical protein